MAFRTGNELHLMWGQRSVTDYGLSQTLVFYARSTNGTTWSAPLRVSFALYPYHLLLNVGVYELVDGTVMMYWIAARGPGAFLREVPLPELTALVDTGHTDPEVPSVRVHPWYTWSTPSPTGHPQIARTPRPGVYIGVWVSGLLADSDISYRYFAYTP